MKLDSPIKDCLDLSKTTGQSGVDADFKVATDLFHFVYLVLCSYIRDLNCPVFDSLLVEIWHASHRDTNQ